MRPLPSGTGVNEKTAGGDPDRLFHVHIPWQGAEQKLYALYTDAPPR